MKTLRIVGASLTALILASCGNDFRFGLPGPLGPPPAVTVRIAPDAAGASVFGSEALQVDNGTEVIWENEDDSEHTVTAQDKAWDSGVIPPGASFSRTFHELGTFSYQCRLHPDETGQIIVRDAGVALPSPTPTPTLTPTPVPTPTPINTPAGGLVPPPSIGF